MSIEKYKQQLIREAKKSPKKAAALGSLLVIALWFWAPLVGGWFSSGSDEAATTTASVQAKPALPFAKQKIGSESQSPTVKTAEVARAPKIEWNELTKWIRSDPLMTPAELPENSRDPFLAHLERSLVEEEEEVEEVEVVVQPAQPVVTPKSLGLTLTSTIVGSKRRVAMIGGRAYRQGKMVYALSDGATIGFLLAEVGERHAVLVRDGRDYELTIQSTGLGSGFAANRPRPSGE